MQDGVDLISQAFLKLRALGRILIVYADQDGVGQLIQIAVAEHRAYECVDGDVKVASLKIHIADYNLRVLVSGIYCEALFFFIYLNLNGRVYIQRDSGGNGIISPICLETGHTADQKYKCCCNTGKTPR